MHLKARLIAFYLPQFHPIPENDEWWGKGFTEWTNVTKAKPLFQGHYQPRLPADLGFYDLRLPEVREAQADLARRAGVEAFCYYHYWFGGKRLLERPFHEVVTSGKPDFPFCLCWANQTWTGIWHGAPNRILIEQTYPGVNDNQRHFQALLKAFLDPRYVRVDGRPLFVIYRPAEIPNVREFIRQWQELAQQNEMPGIHFVAHLLNVDANWDFKAHGFDSCVVINNLRFPFLSLRQLPFCLKSIRTQMQSDPGAFRGVMLHAVGRSFRSFLGLFNNVVEFRHALPFLLDGAKAQPDVYPCLTPNWDNTAGAANRGVVLHNSTPELFRRHLIQGLQFVKGRPAEKRLVFVKSWNEWAEGNYLEPDRKFGHAYLNVIREEVTGVPVDPSGSGALR